jgi:PKD repeat protein
MSSLLTGTVHSTSPSPVSAPPSGSFFDHVVIIAMENQNYPGVLGNGTLAGCPSGTSPFLCSLLPSSSTIPNYHSYGAGDFSSDSISGCSAACYVALMSGNTYGVSDGYSCCLSGTTLVDQMQSAGLTWQAYCEAGCPRGNDHFPFTGFASDANSPNVFTGSSVNTTDFVAAANSASPPNLLWYTPTDNHNMHDNSISSGDSYLQHFVVGSGTVSNPASESLLASSLFTSSSYHTLLYIWWDEYDPSPNILFGSMVKNGFVSASNTYDEYASLRTIESNWGLSALGYAPSAPTMGDMFGSQPLSASYTYAPTAPTLGASVAFTALAVGGTAPYSYSWSFGDGSTGTGASTTHTYSLAGTYTVTLTVKDTSSPQQIATSRQIVSVSNPPPTLTASLSYNPATPQSWQQVTFTGSVAGGTSPYSYSWNYGDGATGSGQTVTHSYSSAGSFAVTLTVKDSGSPQQTVTTQQTISITSPPPPLSASVTYSPSSPQMGQQVTFSGSASGGTSPYSFHWSFGDGSSGSGSSVMHMYSSAGSFTVTLTVTDSGSPQQTATSQQPVTVSTQPTPLITSFSYSPSSPQTGQPVSFTASASGGTTPYSYSWSFGDGGSSTSNPAIYTYTASGSYNVTVTATDADGLKAISSLTITVVAPLTAKFSYSPGVPVSGESVTFTATAIGGTSPYGFSWNLAGTLKSGNPVSSPFLNGTYIISLTVTDGAGLTYFISQPLTVNPAPDFAIAVTSPTPADVGSSASSTITVTLVHGFTGNITLADTFPSGLNCSPIISANISRNNTVTVTCSSLTASNYALTIIGTSGSLTHSTIANFAFVDFAISASPATLVFDTGVSENSTLTIVSLNGFTGTVTMTATGPVRISATLSNATIEGSGTTTLTVSSQTVGEYSIVVMSFSGSLTRVANVTVIVGAQMLPILSVPSTETVNELTALTFRINATDPFTLSPTLILYASQLPPGAVFGTANGTSSVTGMFSWTPNESQAPGTYNVTFTVTDGIISVQESSVITVLEPDDALSLTLPGPQTVAPGETLTFTVSASDLTIPGENVTISAQGLGSNMALDPSSGVFTFTPSRDQMGQKFYISFSASDADNPSASISGTLIIHVDNGQNSLSSLCLSCVSYGGVSGIISLVTVAAQIGTVSSIILLNTKARMERSRARQTASHGTENWVDRPEPSLTLVLEE